MYQATTQIQQINTNIIITRLDNTAVHRFTPMHLVHSNNYSYNNIVVFVHFTIHIIIYQLSRRVHIIIQRKNDIEHRSHLYIHCDSNSYIQDIQGDCLSMATHIPIFTSNSAFIQIPTFRTFKDKRCIKAVFSNF